jgi:hypothetical protein
VSSPVWLQEILRQAVKDLFGHYEAPIVPREAAIDRPFEVAVVIGFISPQMTGKMVLGMDGGAVLASMPAYITTWKDWAGELGNQLLGRVVNQLLRYGVLGQMSTPIVLTSDVLSADGPSWSDARFSVAGCPLGIVFDCDIAAEFIPCLSDLEIANEGETILF